MKNKFWLFPVLILFGFAFVNAFSGNGDGSSTTPYEITNCTQLQEIQSDFAANYTLINDINCSDTINWDNGVDTLGFISIPDLTGTLDGKGFTISDLYIFGGDDVGLFGYISTGIISNVN